MKRSERMILTIVLALLIVVALVTLKPSTEPVTVNETLKVNGIFNVTGVFYPDGKVKSYSVTGSSGVAVFVEPASKGLKIIAVPKKPPSGDVLNGFARIVVETDKKVYNISLFATIYFPKAYFKLTEKRVVLTESRDYVPLEFVPPKDVRASVSVTAVKGEGVKGFEFKNGTLKVFFDLKKLYYVGYERLNIFGTVRFEKGTVLATVNRSWSVQFVYVNLVNAGINTVKPVELIRPFLHYQNGTLNVYAFKVLNKADVNLRLTTVNGEVFAYPIYYKEFPECWKAVAFLSMEKLHRTVGYGCGCVNYNPYVPADTFSASSVLAPNTQSIVYVVTNKTLDELRLEVQTINGFTIQNVTVSGFEAVKYFPTFSVSRVWDTVSKYMPVILATGSDGAPISPIYLSAVSTFINSPVTERVHYNLVLFAIVPNSMSGNVEFKVLAPQLLKAETVAGTPVGSVGDNYTVYEARVSIPGSVFGLIPVDVVLFLGGKPYLVEHTYLMFTNLMKNPVSIPSVKINGKEVPIDYNALEIVKFWGYGVALLRSNITVLTKGGYIMKNDASVTLRLENLTPSVVRDTEVPSARPFKLFNITTALKLMFFGKPSELDAVGIYVKTGNVSEDGYVPVEPLVYTIQPKYAFMDEVLKNPVGFIGVYDTVVNGTPVTVVSNPTPYELKAGNETVKPFSVALVNSTEITVAGETVKIPRSRPLKLVPSNLTAERVLKSNMKSLPYTVVEIPFTPGTGVPDIKSVNVSYDGKRATAKLVSPSTALLTVKQLLTGNPTSPVAYWTVFNGELVLNVVIPGNPAEFSVSFNGFTVSYKGEDAEVIDKVSAYDIAPMPNFYAYYISSYEPVYFQPIPNPYRKG